MNLHQMCSFTLLYFFIKMFDVVNSVLTYADCPRFSHGHICCVSSC